MGCQKVTKRRITGIGLAEFFQPADQLRFPAKFVERIGQCFVGDRALARQTCGEGRLQGREGLGRFAGLGVDAGQVELPQRLVRGGLFALLEGGPRVLKPIGGQEALAHELVAGARLVERQERFLELFVEAELRRVIEGIDHAGKTFGRRLGLVRHQVEPA